MGRDRKGLTKAQMKLLLDALTQAVPAAAAAAAARMRLPLPLWLRRSCVRLRLRCGLRSRDDRPYLDKETRSGSGGSLDYRPRALALA